MAVLAQLDFGKTVAAEALNALFTAVLVGLVAGLLVSRYEHRAAERRRQAEGRHARTWKAASGFGLGTNLFSNAGIWGPMTSGSLHYPPTRHRRR
jgi:hypothetical protein